MYPATTRSTQAIGQGDFASCRCGAFLKQFFCTQRVDFGIALPPLRDLTTSIFFTNALSFMLGLGEEISPPTIAPDAAKMPKL